MTWLVTGGAGYVGAHVVRSMLDSGHQVVVLDDLSTGLADRIDPRAAFIEGSLLEDAPRRRSLEGIDGVVHIAAKKQVGESVAQPLYYYRQNVVALQLLLEDCVDAGIDKLVFSSSCSVYGMPDVDRVVESTPLLPMSPYGESKHTGERMLNAVAVASGLRQVSLRYFNVAGAGAPELGDPEVFHLIPLVFQAMSRNQPVKVFGGDYPTPDGSCIRDYVHVADIADAHRLAADALVGGYPGGTFNIGCGEGSSVLQVIDVVREVTGVDVQHEVVERRAGDPARIVASVESVERELGFRTTRDLREMVASAWEAWRARPTD